MKFTDTVVKVVLGRTPENGEIGKTGYSFRWDEPFNFVDFLTGENINFPWTIEQLFICWKENWRIVRGESIVVSRVKAEFIGRGANILEDGFGLFSLTTGEFIASQLIDTGDKVEEIGSVEL